ncbi:MAG: hypothetical protein AAF990_28365 [Bacteroidota bacterium]
MHDLDRTTLEASDYDQENAYDQSDEFYENEAFEMYDDDNELYEMEDDDGEYYEMEEDEDEEYYEMGDYNMGEEEEAELAFELLAVKSDEEMDEFFRKLVRRAGRGVRRFGRRARKFARSRVGRAIRSRLRGFAKRMLPIAGRVAGGYFGGPVGAKIGGGLGSYATRFFEMEMEGLSPEDQEFEIAKRFVRFGSSAARNVLKNANRMAPGKAIKVGFHKAARQHAPGLLKPQSRQKPSSRGRRKSGRWFLRGNKIVLVGI